MKNQRVGKNYPLHHLHGRGECGKGGHAPGDSPVFEVSPSAEEGQLGQGDTSSGLPCSRPSSELISIPEGHGGAGFESHSPLDWVPGSSAGLFLSWSVIMGCFWAYFTCVGFAGQSTTTMLSYKLPYSPSHAPLFLAEARGSGWGVGLPALVGAAGSVGHTQGVVGSLWGFAADVTGVAGITGVTGLEVVPGAMTSVGALGVVGVTGAMTRKMGWVEEE